MSVCYCLDMKTNMKHLGGITAAILITAGLAGCASRTVTSTPQTTTTTRYVAPTTTMKTYSQTDKVDGLVATLQKKFPGTSRAQVIDLAHQGCAVVEESGSVAAAVRGIVLDDEIDAETAGDMSYVIGVAIPVYCPKYLPELLEFTK